MSLPQPDTKAPTAGNAELLTASAARVAEIMQTDLSHGLAAEDAQGRLLKYGPNEVASVAATRWWQTLIHQFISSVVVLLLIALVLSVLLKEYTQAAAIGAAIFINAAIGFFTERQAEVSLARLKKLAGGQIRVLRAGVEVELPIVELVPGDLVKLESGVRVPADMRIVECASFSVDESALTGESVCVFKSAEPLPGGKVEDMQVFAGTTVAAGRAMAVVTATGRASRLGSLGKLLSETTSGATPLEKELDHLGGQLTWLTVILSVTICGIGVAVGQPFWYMVQVGIALAVAAIPEGLQLLATLALAIGTQRMVRLGALVRRLASVETLGCTTVICTDKTGTLTENQLVVSDIVLFRLHIKVTGSGYDPAGSFTDGGRTVDPSLNHGLSELLRAGMLCNDASLAADPKTGKWAVLGDPTEGALLVAGGKAGYSPDDLLRQFPRAYELPFDLSRKRMTTLHRIDKQYIAFTKGSPESVLSICSHYLDGGNVRPLDPASSAHFIEQNVLLAARGLRVLAVAVRTSVRERQFENCENEMTLLGLVGMADRPKEGVTEAIADAHKAGIEVVMITGDQSATGESIARELGILHPGWEDAVVTGKELESIAGADLAEKLKSVAVIARATPELKLSVVQGLQRAGNVVAMTGDGVNDAPALKQANIGIAMGLRGSDLARDVSALVLTDDNFSTIIRAIKFGRSIYQNIRQAVGYLLTASLASVMAVSGSVILGLGAHITPLQLLWLNLIMHVFPGLGMVLQPSDPEVMNRPPRKTNQRLFGMQQFSQICLRAVVAATSAFICLEYWHVCHYEEGALPTVALCALSLSLMYQAWSWLFIADGQLRLSRINWQISVSMLCSYSLLLVALYLPGLNTILDTTPLSLSHMTEILGIVTVGWLVSEAAAYLVLRCRKRWVQ